MIDFGLVVFILILSTGPLLVFLKNLRKERRRGTFEYGALAGEVGRQFEQKWLSRAGAVDERVLDAPDFSSTTDLYQIVANVYGMKDVPFGLRSLAHLIGITLLPFAPVVLMAIPLDEIIKDLAKLLM
jgi:hypothetical protein